MMSIKKKTILLLTGTMLCSLKLQAMDAQIADEVRRISSVTTITTTIDVKRNNETLKATLDPYERHLVTFDSIKSIVKQSIMREATNQNDEEIRVRCLWNLGTPTHRAAALKILERQALSDNSPIKIRINLLKKFGEYLQNTRSHLLDLELLEEPSFGEGQEAHPSRLFLFYKTILDDISQSNCIKGEKDFQILKLKTFYNRLPQKLTQVDANDLNKNINNSFQNLQASISLSRSLLLKIVCFQNLYLKFQPVVQILENIGEEAFTAAMKTQNSEESKRLWRVASKVRFKMASLIPNDIPEFQRKSAEYFYYNKAAQLGHSLAKYYLGELCDTKLYETLRSGWYNPDQAYVFYLSAAQDNNPLATYKIAKTLEKGDERISLAADKERALMWYQKAAKQGHPYAQYELAQDLFTKGNIAEALRLLFLAAEAGYEIAQLALAEKYATGEGIEKNPVFSFFWYAKAALQGSYSAHSPLGYAYEKGIGVEQDYERANYFYRLGAYIPPLFKMQMQTKSMEQRKANL